MKTTFKFRLVIIFCLLICFGCSKDSVDDDGDPVIVDYGTIQARVTGLITIQDNTTIEFRTLTISTRGEITYILGNDFTNMRVGIQIMFLTSINSTGTYYYPEFGFSIMEGPIGWHSLYTFNHGSREGSITISEINSERIVGTFEFTCTNIGNSNAPDIVVSEGSFNILRE